MLGLEIEKSKRSEKIRKTLFDDDSDVSSLSLSLLDNSFVNMEKTSIDASTENYSLPLLSNRERVGEISQEIEHSCPQIEENSTIYHTTEYLISDNVIISDTSSSCDVYYDIDVQKEEVILLPRHIRNESLQ